MRLKAPSWLRVVIYSVNSFIYGIIVTFFSKAEWTEIYKSKLLPKINSPIALILLPIVLILNIILCMIAIIEIINNGATSKNIASFFVEFFKTIQTSASIITISAAITASALLVPIITVLVNAYETIFNGFNCLVHLWKWKNAVHDNDYQKNKMLSAKFAVNFLACSLITVFIGITLLSNIGTAALLAVGILAACFMIVGGVSSVIFGHYADKKISKIEHTEEDDASVVRNVLHEYQRLPSETESMDLIGGEGGREERRSAGVLSRVSSHSSALFHYQEREQEDLDQTINSSLRR